MVYYHFAKSQGELEEFDVVEKALLEALNAEPEYSPALGSRSAQFETLCWVGIAATFHGNFSEETFTKVMTGAQYDSVRDVYKDFLSIRYKFVSYRLG
jgi:hypothetical protein